MLSHTTVYHSIRRGNRGKGIVKANRSRIRDKKTMVSTFTIALEVRFDVEENRNSISDQNTRCVTLLHLEQLSTTTVTMS